MTDDAIEQFRKTIDLNPDWALVWAQLAWLLLEVGEYDEGLEAYVEDSRLRGADLEAARQAYQATIRYHRTGVPQTPPAFDAGPPEWRFWLSVHVGQVDRAIDVFETAVRDQTFLEPAYFHAFLSSDLLRDDPRYQALLAEAGITW